jgi:hypothetical protein
MENDRQSVCLAGAFYHVMNLYNEAYKQITLHVQDQNSTNYEVRLTVNEQPANGTLAILTPGGDVTQHFRLTQIKKGKNGTQLTCTIQGATATLTIDRSKNPLELRVVATLFFPIFNATYCLSQIEYQRLARWINSLSIGALA